MNLPDFLTTHGIIEGWILTATTFEQLLLLQEIIDQYISKDRFPEEKPEVIGGAKLVLLSKLEYQMDVLKAQINKWQIPAIQ